ncbi:hypothetical protein AQUCO_01100151v1 [Aquilegia coerulea]|uniref:Uncharacterized protein n=1 Tax=Aquilegia coerulea TaxID=218851 RepID=A0A2G5E6E6_AQUCA|nr:hypothetical protein AQUCO_01100151v1 [Aquilegia coerulea]
MLESDHGESLHTSVPKPPLQMGRPTSMVVKRVHNVIPAHLLAEAISQLHGIWWSGPVTPSETQYVEQYVFTKYPQYYNGLVEEDDKDDPFNNEEMSTSSPAIKRKHPSPSFGNNHLDLDKIKLEPSRLLDLLKTKSSYPGTFISIPEIQARSKVLKHFGLTEDDYQVLFTPKYKDAMMLVGESYPFFRGNFYLTIIHEEVDCIREFATLTRLFSYPAEANGTCYSMHWTTEAHRNSWHVLLDATGIVLGEDHLDLSPHQPDFVLKSLDTSSFIQAQE